MAAEAYDKNESGGKPTQGVGNAGGKPIRPILFGVGAVIALILVSLALSRSGQKANDGRSESGPVPQAQYSPASTSDTALGQRSQAGNSDTASRPATAPTDMASGDATSMSGSSSLPAPGTTFSPSPSASPSTGSASAGQNFVAPPGPAVNGQGANR